MKVRRSSYNLSPKGTNVMNRSSLLLGVSRSGKLTQPFQFVEVAGPAPVAAKRRIGNKFPPPPLFLHEPGRFEGTQAETSRLDGCRQTLEVERVRPQTTRRQLVTETRSNGFYYVRVHCQWKSGG